MGFTCLLITLHIAYLFQTPMPCLPFHALLGCLHQQPLIIGQREPPSAVVRVSSHLLFSRVFRRSEHIFQETFNASFSYEVCMHASSPVKQTNEIFLQLFSPSTAPLDPPCLHSPPHPHLSSPAPMSRRLVYFLLHPYVLRASTYSLRKPSPVCDVAYIRQPHATWMIRVAGHDIADSRARSRLASAIGPPPWFPCLIITLAPPQTVLLNAMALNTPSLFVYYARML
jgi:hypothetical protein